MYVLELMTSLLSEFVAQKLGCPFTGRCRGDKYWGILIIRWDEKSEETIIQDVEAITSTQDVEKSSTSTADEVAAVVTQPSFSTNVITQEKATISTTEVSADEKNRKINLIISHLIKEQNADVNPGENANVPYFEIEMANQPDQTDNNAFRFVVGSNVDGSAPTEEQLKY